MHVEGIFEQRERMLREAKQLGTQRAGRTLPIGAEWVGHDQPGCAAMKRRLRQIEKLTAKKGKEDGQTEASSADIGLTGQVGS